MPRLIFALVLMLAGVHAHAARVEGLHEAEVPTTDREQRAQTKAIQSAMRQVLIKLTGNPEIETLPVAQDLIRSARNLMVQFRYAIPEQPREDLPLLLWVGFDERAVDEALERAGVFLWGNERPATLVWLTAEAPDNQARLIGGDDTDGFASLVRREAKRRGIPVVFPLLDLQDAATLSAEQVAAGDRQAIGTASLRYDTATVLAGSLRAVDEDRWQARWQLLDGQFMEPWGLEGSLDGVLRSAIDTVADTLYYQYAAAVVDVAEGGLQFTVSGVNELADYAALQQYLESLSELTKIQLLAVEEDRVTYFVSARSGVESLDQSFALGKRLLKEGEGLYRLLPYGLSE